MDKEIISDPSVCIVNVYFGRLPVWFDIWLNSVKYNPTVDFLLVTDQDVENHGIGNLKIKKSSLENFRDLAEQKLKCKIKLNTPYKLCDYKGVWGVILEDDLSQYQYWGGCDIDVVFGDLRKFFRNYKLQEFDKFGNRGHLTIYRNTKEVNCRYKLNGGWFGSYKEVFSSNMIWAFDETPGMNAIYEANNFPHMNEFIYADIDVNYKDLRLVDRDISTYVNYEKQIFYWSHGKLFRSYSLENEIFTDEFMYIHLQKRKMNYPNFKFFNTDEFYITNGEFLKKDGAVNVETIQRLNPRNDVDVASKFFGGEYKKDLRFYWIGRRFLNMKYEIKLLIKKIILIQR